VLIPSLCCMTGLTDAHRAKFQLMKELSEHLHKPAFKRVQQVKELIQNLKSSEKVKKEMALWRMEISEEPVKLQGQQILGGMIQMGSNYEFDVDQSLQDFDRKIQRQMFDQPKIAKWGIFHGRNSVKEAQQFRSTLGKVIGDFRYDATPIHTFEVGNGDNY